MIALGLKDGVQFNIWILVFMTGMENEYFILIPREIAGMESIKGKANPLVPIFTLLLQKLPLGRLIKKEVFYW